MKKRNLRAIVIGMVALAAITGCSKSTATKDTETTSASTSTYSGTTENSTKNYMSDTSYKGDTALDIELFQYSFQTSDDYVNNKELIQQLRDEDQRVTKETSVEGEEESQTAEPATMSTEELRLSGLTAIGTQKLEYLKEYAKEYVETLFGTGYREIETDEDGFIAKIEDMMLYDTYLDDYDNYYSRNELIKAIADWMVENHVQADVTFNTDDSLVCMNDNSYTVRGTLTIDAYNCDSDEMSEAIPKGLDYKNGGKYVFDVIIGNYANTGFCVSGFYAQGV